MVVVQYLYSCLPRNPLPETVVKARFPQAPHPLCAILAFILLQAAIPSGQQQQLAPLPRQQGSSSNSSGWLEKANAGRTNEDTLEKTLFVRLAKLGVDPLLLGRQYRCHPRLSALASRLFYQGRYDDVCLQLNY